MRLLNRVKPCRLKLGKHLGSVERGKPLPGVFNRIDAQHRQQCVYLPPVDAVEPSPQVIKRLNARDFQHRLNLRALQSGNRRLQLLAGIDSLANPEHLDRQLAGEVARLNLRELRPVFLDGDSPSVEPLLQRQNGFR